MSCRGQADTTRHQGLATANATRPSLRISIVDVGVALEPEPGAVESQDEIAQIIIAAELAISDGPQPETLLQCDDVPNATILDRA